LPTRSPDHPHAPLHRHRIPSGDRFLRCRSVAGMEVPQLHAIGQDRCFPRALPGSGLKTSRFRRRSVIKHNPEEIMLMSVFRAPSFRDHEQVVFCNDPASGLKAIIAIHDTTLGPALGGCRMWSYADDDEALDDVLRLSRGMTYKSALAGLDFG